MIIKFFCIVVLLFLAIGSLRTAQLSFTKNQETFLQHSSITIRPDGFYAGSVTGFRFSWQGKTFDAEHHTGINVFQDEGGTLESRYPFVTSIGRGVHDYETDVMRIDYNVPQNPWWLRLVLDEIVEVEPGHFLGKLEVRIIPYFPFTLTYFELRK